MHEKKTTPHPIDVAESDRIFAAKAAGDHRGAQDPWKTAPKDRLAHMNRKDRRTLAAQARKAQSKADAKRRKDAAAAKVRAEFERELEARYARSLAIVDEAAAAAVELRVDLLDAAAKDARDVRVTAGLRLVDK